ncbi:hypothetical protein ACLB2K_050161 [Fragaria x ananassa]
MLPILRPGRFRKRDLRRRNRPGNNLDYGLAIRPLVSNGMRACQPKKQKSLRFFNIIFISKPFVHGLKQTSFSMQRPQPINQAWT